MKIERALSIDNISIYLELLNFIDKTQAPISSEYLLKELQDKH